MAQAAVDNLKDDIFRASPLDLFDAVQAATSNKASPIDFVVPEMIQALPRWVKIALCRLFEARLHGKRNVATAWKLIVMVGLAKECGANGFPKLRCIARTPTLQQVYMRILMQKMQLHNNLPPKVADYWFRGGCCCTLVSELFREILWKCIKSNLTRTSFRLASLRSMTF